MPVFVHLTVLGQFAGTCSCKVRRTASVVEPEKFGGLCLCKTKQSIIIAACYLSV